MDEVINEEIDLDSQSIFLFRDIYFTIKMVYEEELREEYAIIDFDYEKYPILENIIFCSGPTVKEAIINFIDIVEDLLDD